MTKQRNWSEIGFAEGLDGLPPDAPHLPGHPDHAIYMRSHRAGEREALRRAVEATGWVLVEEAA